MGTHLFDRIEPFKGPLDRFLIHNWLLTAPLLMPGFPLAITDDADYAPIGFDLTLLKSLFADVEAKWIGVLGEQGFGKTFLSNVFLMLAMGADVGGGSARCAINSVKRNQMNRPETAPLVEDLLRCTIIDPRRMKLNPLSRLIGLTFDEQFTLVRRMVEVSQREEFSLQKKNVLKQALKEVREHERPSFPELSRILSDYEPLDEDLPVNPLVGPDDVALPGLEASGPNGRQPKAGSLLEQFRDELRHAAFELKLAIDVFNEGDFFSIFSGESDEIVELMSQRAVSYDMKGIEGDVRSIIELVLGAIQMSAIRPDPDDPINPNRPKHPERIPHYIVTDEAYTPWENSFFAEAEYVKMKTQREHGIVGMTIFHRLRDLQDAIANPVAAKKAANSLNEITVWCIFRQKRAEIPNIRAFFGLAEYILQDLVHLPKGHFWLIVPGQAPRRCFVVGTDLMINTFNTDAANDALLQLWFATRDPKVLQKYLIATTPEVIEDEEEQGAGVLYERTLAKV